MDLLNCEADLKEATSDKNYGLRTRISRGGETINLQVFREYIPAAKLTLNCMLGHPELERKKNREVGSCQTNVPLRACFPAHLVFEICGVQPPQNSGVMVATAILE